MCNWAACDVRSPKFLSLVNFLTELVQRGCSRSAVCSCCRFKDVAVSESSFPQLDGVLGLSMIILKYFVMFLLHILPSDCTTSFCNDMSAC
jgi:hypothetical protein